jgi:hypothetical protein
MSRVSTFQKHRLSRSKDAACILAFDLEMAKMLPQAMALGQTDGDQTALGRF